MPVFSLFSPFSLFNLQPGSEFQTHLELDYARQIYLRADPPKISGIEAACRAAVR
jgi:hypothetical protein